MTAPNTSKQPRPFHARIFRVYLGYLRDKLHWNDEQVQKLLKEVEVSQERLDDDATWFDIDFADRFYDTVVRLTGDHEIAFHAGTYVKKNAFSAILYYMMRGVVSVDRLYRFLAKFSPHFTKAASIVVVETTANRAIVESIPNEGYVERPYMCENRKGIMMGLPQVLDLPLAVIRETECLHKGGTKCRYEIQWQERSELHWVSGSLVAVASVFLLGYATLGFAKAAIGGVVTILALLAAYLRNRNAMYTRELQLQNRALEDALRDIERKNGELKIVSEISQQTHLLVSPTSLAQTLVRTVCELLGYDRAILLTTDYEKKVLGVTAYHGFAPEMEELLSQTEFNLREDNMTGFFIRVVNTKAPVLIPEISKYIQQLSPRSQKFAKLLGAMSFVAVPLTDVNQKVLGVLAVDYVDNTRKMTISDQDLLMTLADHLSIALHNAKMVDQLERNLENTKRFSKQQELLRRTFQKFVPTDIASQLAASIPDHSQGLSGLALVRKRQVAIMFCDMFNFSVLSQTLEPEDVIDLLNTTFSILEPCVSDLHGFVDKFTGDGFLAVFEEPDSCLKACAAAVRLISSMKQVNRALREKKYPEISIGVGINFGSVILGNVGSEDRLNFTVIGDPVNLAARVESYTRVLGPNSICIAASVYERVKRNPTCTFRDLGSVQLKGQQELTTLYELLAEKSSLENVAVR